MALFYPFCGGHIHEGRGKSCIAFAIKKCPDAERSYDLRSVGLLS